MVFLVASVRIIYSALIDNKAILDCFFEYQLIYSLEKMPILALTKQCTWV